MIEPNVSSLSVPEIEDLIARNDSRGFLSSRLNYYKNFQDHFLRIIKAGQILSFRDEGKLIGIISWVLVDKHSKQQINKVRWTLPEDISSGDILYIDLCVIEGKKVNLFVVKDYLSRRYRDKIRFVYWYDMGAGKVFKQKIKTEEICQTVG